MPACILIIEDNSQNLELMRYLLAAHGYEVLTATDGAAATELLADAQPDLIICDIQMPRMDGIEFVGWLRRDERLQHIPALAVTALAMVGDREKILAAGFDGYLSKPIAPETFVRDSSVYLPTSLQMPAPHVPAPSQVRARVALAGPPVLLVDNLQSNLDLEEIVLENLGYTALQAKGMREALQRLEETRPELILSDVCMDDGSGFEFLRIVKGNPELRDIPFILITSTADNTRDRLKGLGLGADRYLFRPIEPRVLRAELEACLAKRKGKA